MLKILKNEALDASLEKEGYVVLPFLNEIEVQSLVNLYYQYHTEKKEGFYATAHSTDSDFKMHLNAEILKQFSRGIEEYFFECRPLGGSFIAKYSGQYGSLPPHQDWSIVDEAHFRSFNIWIPLVDTNEENGAIAVLPRSHRLVNSYRGVNIPDPFFNISDYTIKHHHVLNMKAGEALLYDHRLLHASSINKTETPRLAVVFGIIPNEAEMRYYFMENGILAEYESNVDFFMRNNILNGPHHLKKLRSINYTVQSLSIADFDALYFGTVPQKTTASASPTLKANWSNTIWERLKSIFV